MTSSRRADAVWTVALAGGFCLLACASLAFTLEAGRPAAVWPADALAVVALLRSPGRRWPALVIAAFIGGCCAGWLSGLHAAMVPVLSAANCLESFLCAWFMQRGSQSTDLTRPAVLARFSVTALLVAPILPSVFAGTVRTLALQTSYASNVLIWWAAHALGLLIFTPALLTLVDKRTLHLFDKGTRFRTALCFGLLLAACCGVFLQTRYPVLFIIPSVLAFVTVQLGLAGAVWGLLATSIFAIVASIAGHGPAALVYGSMTEHIFVVQAFLVFLTASILPLAAMLAERDRLQADVATSRDEAKAAVARLSDLNRKAQMAEQMANVGHWHLDLVTGIPTWSEQVFRIYGMDAAAKPDIEQAIAAYHADDRKAVEALVADAIETGQCYAFEARIVRDGEERIVIARAECEADDDGKVTAILGTVMDVTEMKRAQAAMRESELRFRALAENSSDMLMRLTLDGTFSYVSPAVEKISGFRPRELVGKSSLQLVDARDIGLINAAVLSAIRSPDKRAPHKIVYRGTHKSGQPIWLESQPYAQVDPTTDRVIAVTDVVRDVTERVELEDALRAAKAAAEAASVAKSDFLSNMSHELRTPLTAIVGFAELLRDSGNLPPREQLFAERVETASHALRGLVNDILDYSKIEAGMIDFELSDVDADEIVFSCLSILSGQAEKKGLTLSADLPASLPAMRSDQTRLRQIVLNLLSNAVKFTASGSVVVAAAPRPNGTVRISVTDTGTGIKPKDADRLFERFTQADTSTTRRYGGTGLGLAICKGLTEGMGGQIGVDSEFGKGSTFWVELPIVERRLTVVAA